MIQYITEREVNNMKENKITTIRLYEDDLETIEKMKKYVKETWNIDLETAAIIRMALRELENIYIKKGE